MVYISLGVFLWFANMEKLLARLAMFCCGDYFPNFRVLIGQSGFLLFVFFFPLIYTVCLMKFGKVSASYHHSESQSVGGFRILELNFLKHMASELAVVGKEKIGSSCRMFLRSRYISGYIISATWSQTDCKIN